MTKSPTSNTNSLNKDTVKRVIGRTKGTPEINKNISTIREEFDPIQYHDELLTRLAEIKAQKDELKTEEDSIKKQFKKELLAMQDDGEEPKLSHSNDESLFVNFRKTHVYQFSEELEQRIANHTVETKKIKNKKDSEILEKIAKYLKTNTVVVLNK
tara:strand:+ start:504 stop:971 length:468 start_codon:yes stop_codon:yes gene_type:complete